jgi:hypothetical protein
MVGKGEVKLDFNLDFSFIPTVILIACLIYLFVKRESEEPFIAWKIVGYYLLGSFQVNLDGLWIPIGIIIYFGFFRPTENIKTKFYAAIIGFVFMLLGKLIPYM